MKNFFKNIVSFVAFFIIFIWMIIVYIDFVCIPFSNSDTMFSLIFIGGFVALDIAIRIEERFKLFDKVLVNRKALCFILALAGIILVYNFALRYKYRTYKGNYNQVQVIKVDTLTGKSTVTFPEYVENNKK